MLIIVMCLSLLHLIVHLINWVIQNFSLHVKLNLSLSGGPKALLKYPKISPQTQEIVM